VFAQNFVSDRPGDDPDVPEPRPGRRFPDCGKISEGRVQIPYLRLDLIHLWVACIAVAAVIAGLAMGQVSASTFVGATVIGLAFGVPAAPLTWVHLRPDRSRQIGWIWKIADWARTA
jgi:hypothetical protein